MLVVLSCIHKKYFILSLIVIFCIAKFEFYSLHAQTNNWEINSFLKEAICPCKKVLLWRKKMFYLMFFKDPYWTGSLLFIFFISDLWKFTIFIMILISCFQVTIWSLWSCNELCASLKTLLQWLILNDVLSDVLQGSVLDRIFVIYIFYQWLVKIHNFYHDTDFLFPSNNLEPLKL